MFDDVDEAPTGYQLLADPFLNKGTGFTERERDELGLRGLLPPKVFTQDEQVQRVLENFNRKPSNLERYIFLTSLQDRNERLFYKTVMAYIEEMMPIIYTPTVGEACREYAHIRRKSPAMFLAATDRGKIRDILPNWPQEDVRVIVVTDGERILGLGDLGANGIGIPIGKLSLYTACAGIPPEKTLPVVLDVGTNNEELRRDPVYMGLDQERLTGEEYDSFIDEFVWAVLDVFPNALIQFEDFGNRNAFRLLRRYRDKVCTFNDDIQGTAAVTMAGIHGALRIKNEKLIEQRILFSGAGEAGIGIAELLVEALAARGMEPEESKKLCWFMDSKGLVVKSRKDLSAEKAQFAQEHEGAESLLDAVKRLKPSILVGVSGQPQTFTKEIIEAMAEYNERPIIFALSNPTSKSECTAEQAYSWSEGRAIFASGSPFDPVEFGGRRFVPGQGNNAYVFPGVGLGVVASRAIRVSNSMFLTAARSLAAQLSEDDLLLGRVYPSLKGIRKVSRKIAVEVFKEADRLGYAREPMPDDLEEYVASLQYDPTYPEYV
ncbi:MAG: NAD-dependent malic enzyme [Candidatus Latescibacterota bacterium]|jgi:malate dehydrogenase (oxaloacetate-decarboxylating)(NADP+)